MSRRPCRLCAGVQAGIRTRILHVPIKLERSGNAQFAECFIACNRERSSNIYPENARTEKDKM